jgi:hypothetical protein
MKSRTPPRRLFRRQAQTRVFCKTRAGGVPNRQRRNQMQCSSVNSRVLPLNVVSVASPHTLPKVSFSVSPACGPFCMLVAT